MIFWYVETLSMHSNSHYTNNSIEQYAVFRHAPPQFDITPRPEPQYTLLCKCCGILEQIDADKLCDELDVECMVCDVSVHEIQKDSLALIYHVRKGSNRH